VDGEVERVEAGIAQVRIARVGSPYPRSTRARVARARAGARERVVLATELPRGVAQANLLEGRSRAARSTGGLRAGRVDVGVRACSRACPAARGELGLDPGRRVWLVTARRTARRLPATRLLDAAPLRLALAGPGRAHDRRESAVAADARCARQRDSGDDAEGERISTAPPPRRRPSRDRHGSPNASSICCKSAHARR